MSVNGVVTALMVECLCVYAVRLGLMLCIVSWIYSPFSMYYTLLHYMYIITSAAHVVVMVTTCAVQRRMTCVLI